MGRKMRCQVGGRAEGLGGVCREGVRGAWEIHGEVRVQRPEGCVLSSVDVTACMYFAKVKPQGASTAMENAASPRSFLPAWGLQSASWSC